MTKAWRKRDTLTPDELADVRVAVGWAVPAADVQGTEELHGPWLVLAPTAATTDG